MVQVNPLIIVDVQNGFVNSSSAHVVGPIADFAETWLARGGRVIATRFINPPDSQWEHLIHWTRLRESPETDLAPAIAALATHPNVTVVDKSSYTSLVPAVQEILAAVGASGVLICGIATDGCVLKTAVDIFENGLTPRVLTDLCASHAGAEVHAAGLHLTGRFIGKDQLIQSSQAL